jgi:hypothetical protein
MSNQASGQMNLAQLEDLGHRLDKAYDLACKGVHASISELEANQCVMQTYLLIADILRLTDNRAK